jgi:hypothetical protein
VSSQELFFVRPGQTIDWQPPRYKEMNLSNGPVFSIKIMTEGQRRELQEKIQQATMADAEAWREGKKSHRVDMLHEEIMTEYVTRITNVPGAAFGLDGEDANKIFTVGDPDKLLKTIYAMPSNDGKALDNAIWNIQSLLSGQTIKNSGCSHGSPATTPGGPTTPAKAVKS